MIDWSMVASIASSFAGIVASLSAAYLGKLKYHAHRRRQDAIIDARKRGDMELAKSLSDIQPPIPGFLPPLLFADMKEARAISKRVYAEQMTRGHEVKITAKVVKSPLFPPGSTDDK